MREKSKGSFGAWVNDGAARCKEWNGFGVGTAEGDPGGYLVGDFTREVTRGGGRILCLCRSFIVA